jgi:VanZ family protein
MTVIPAPLLTASTPRWSSAGFGLIIAYMLLLIYASLSPFRGWQWPQAITLFEWPKYITSFDNFINVVAYVPFGAMLASRLRRRLLREQRQRPHLYAGAVALFIAASFSICMELLQSFLPTRVTSSLDVLTNTSGALLGVLLVLSAIGRGWIARAEHWRLRHFAHQAHVDWGLLIVGMWLCAQLNPAIPFFESGLVAANVVKPGIALTSLPTEINSVEFWTLMPQAIGIALNVTAFSLLISLILHPMKRALLNVLLVLMTGLLAKIFMAALLLKAPQLASTLSPATLIGLTSGLLLFIFISKRAFRWRAFWATLAVFAGGAFSKISSVYSALDDTLKLFNWPHGQLANFANLTSWINEVWPLVAVVYLALLFLRGRKPLHGAVHVKSGV